VQCPTLPVGWRVKSCWNLKRPVPHTKPAGAFPFAQSRSEVASPYRTTMTLQNSDAGRRGVQLKTLAPDKGPSRTGKVQVSESRSVPVGKTEMKVETDALFAL
jgi:hypothetical protein